MHINEMKDSKFLKQTDVGAGIKATITGVDQQNVAKEGAEPEMKWAMHFEEIDKPLILNSTNIQLAAKVCGSQDTDDWTGKTIVLYTDPNVSYGGKIVGGIRIRAMRAQKPVVPVPVSPIPVAPAPPSAVGVPVYEDDIPFIWLMPLMGAVLLGHSLLA